MSKGYQHFNAIAEHIGYVALLKKKYAPNANIEHFLCPNGCVFALDMKDHDFIDFILEISCIACKHEWSICKKGCFCRIHLKDYALLKKYLTKFHKECAKKYLKWDKEEKHILDFFMNSIKEKLICRGGK
eukprot:6654177-Ditylum_brightwellii.AAC.1